MVKVGYIYSKQLLAYGITGWILKFTVKIKQRQIVMQKNIKIPSQPWQVPIKPVTIGPIKTEKALKLLAVDTQASKPFRRKQEHIVSNKKNQYEDIGKLISNTSFGSSPDIRKIVSTSPKHCFESRLVNEDGRDDRKGRAVLRESKSYSDMEKVAQIFRVSSARMLGSVENLYSGRADQKNATINTHHVQIKQKRSQYQNMRTKIHQLTNQKKQLSHKYTILQKKLQQLQVHLSQKENVIAQLNLQLSQKISQNEQQKQIIKCMEDIIMELNQKIDQMLTQREQQHRQQRLCTEGQQKQQLQSQLQHLQQHIFTLNRKINGLQVQNIIMKKIKQELQKQKQLNKCLDKENKGLKERILIMMKIGRMKSAKLSLKQELDYSVSFQIQH